MTYKKNIKNLLDIYYFTKKYLKRKFKLLILLSLSQFNQFYFKFDVGWLYD